MLTETNRVVFSTGKDDWETPHDLFAQLDAEFQFGLDVASNKTNAKVTAYLGPDQGDPRWRDALSVSWREVLEVTWGDWRRPCWMNPPYSSAQARFIAKAAYERTQGVTTVCLLPARTDTKAFHAWIWDHGTHRCRDGVEARFLKGRLKFAGAANSAPFPSMIVVFHGLGLSEPKEDRHDA